MPTIVNQYANSLKHLKYITRIDSEIRIDQRCRREADKNDGDGNSMYESTKKEFVFRMGSADATGEKIYESLISCGVIQEFKPEKPLSRSKQLRYRRWEEYNYKNCKEMFIHGLQMKIAEELIEAKIKYNDVTQIHDFIKDMVIKDNRSQWHDTSENDGKVTNQEIDFEIEEDGYTQIECTLSDLVYPYDSEFKKHHLSPSFDDSTYSGVFNSAVQITFTIHLSSCYETLNHKSATLNLKYRDKYDRNEILYYGLDRGYKIERKSGSNDIKQVKYDSGPLSDTRRTVNFNTLMCYKREHDRWVQRKFDNLDEIRGIQAVNKSKLRKAFSDCHIDWNAKMSGRDLEELTDVVNKPSVRSYQDFNCIRVTYDSGSYLVFAQKLSNIEGFESSYIGAFDATITKREKKCSASMGEIFYKQGVNAKKFEEVTGSNINE